MYRHYRTQQEYLVLGVAFETENHEKLVIYKPLYPCEHELFARPLKMFLEEVEWEGKRMPRFAFIREK